MTKEDAYRLAKETDGYVPVKVIAGTINSKNRVDTYTLLPKNQVIKGNTIELFNDQWVIEIVNFREDQQMTIFIVPLE